MRCPRAAKRPRISEPTPLNTATESSGSPGGPRPGLHVLAEDLAKKNAGITD